jgi:hypothetical protein
MRHFTHSVKLHWKELHVGMTLTCSEYNNPERGPRVIERIKECNSCSRNKCGSDGTAVILDGITNCIFNHQGKSYWKEVEDL